MTHDIVVGVGLELHGEDLFLLVSVAVPVEVAEFVPESKRAIIGTTRADPLLIINDPSIVGRTLRHFCVRVENILRDDAFPTTGFGRTFVDAVPVVEVERQPETLLLHTHVTKRDIDDLLRVILDTYG